MSRIYTELATEYGKKVYNPSECTTEAGNSQDVQIEDSEEPKEADKIPSPSSSNRKEWSSLEILNLLKGIYQYGEPKWVEIHSTFEFEDKTPHDLSIKWMDIRYQLTKEQKRAENNTSKRRDYSSSLEKQSDYKNSTSFKNEDIKSYSTSGKNWLMKSEKLLAPIQEIGNGYKKIPILANSSKNAHYDFDEEEDPEMRHYIDLIDHNMKIFKITKNASKDDISDYGSEFGGRHRHKRRRMNEDGEYETCSDFTED